jgi:hypothetical protein
MIGQTTKLSKGPGAVHEQIGRALKTNRGNAWRLVQRALPPLERSEHELQLELFRIDQALMSIWPQVRQGELQAVQTFARPTETRSRVRSRFYEQRWPASSKRGDRAAGPASPRASASQRPH